MFVFIDIKLGEIFNWWENGFLCFKNLRLFWYSERHSKEEMNLGKLICLYTLNLTLAKVKFYDWTIILFI